MMKSLSKTSAWTYANDKTWAFVGAKDASEVEGCPRRFSEWLPKMCNIRFEVCGKRIPSVKFSLATHSDVFAVMFFGDGHLGRTMHETLDGVEIVSVDDCSAEGIRVLNAYALQFFKEASIAASNIGDVLYVADKYAVDGLRQCCDEYLVEVINRNDGHEMVEVLASLSHFNLRAVCESMLEIFDLAKVLFAFEAPKLLPEWIVPHILASNHLALTEADVFKATEAWCKRRCLMEDAMEDELKEVEEVKSDSEDSESMSVGIPKEGHIRKLKALLPLMRLPLMDMTFFSKRVCAVPGLLKDSTKLAVMRNAANAPLECGFPRARAQQPFVVLHANVYWISGSKRRFTVDNGHKHSQLLPANVFWSKGTHSWSVQLNNDKVRVGVGVDVMDEVSQKNADSAAAFTCVFCLKDDGKLFEVRPPRKRKELTNTLVRFGVEAPVTISVDCEQSVVQFDNGRKWYRLPKGKCFRPLIWVKQLNGLTADFTITYFD